MSLLSRHAEKVCSRLDFGRRAVAARYRSLHSPAQGPDAAYAVDPSGLASDPSQHRRRPGDAASLGVLDPADSRTKANVAAIRRILDGIPSHRLHVPARDVMTDAAVYAGLLRRLQGYAKDRRMKALRDCTLFFQARRLGCTLLTANVVDFDCSQQLRPEGRVLFYDTI